MKPAFLLLYPLLACAATPTALRPHEQKAGAAARIAWRERGLPEPIEGRCDVDRYEVIVTTDAAGFNRYCPTSRADKTAGCLAWRSSDHWFRWRDRPLVVISPKHHSEPTIVVHELMHAYYRCAGLSKSDWDPGDRGHTDPRVWSAAGGETAAQTRADALTKEML
jgi:hypothetical protein